MPHWLWGARPRRERNGRGNHRRPTSLSDPAAVVAIAAIILVPLAVVLYSSLRSPRAILHQHTLVTSTEVVQRDVPASECARLASIAGSYLIGQVPAEDIPPWLREAWVRQRDRYCLPMGKAQEDYPLDALWFTTKTGQVAAVVRFDHGGVRPCAGRARDDPARMRLATWLQINSDYVVGETDRVSGEFTAHYWTSRAKTGEHPPAVFWRGNTLLFCYERIGPSRRAENIVVDIDVLTGDAQVILGEEQRDPSRGPMGHRCLSPDGRWLAFDRLRLPSAIADVGTSSGLWLLDLVAGTCHELTSESTTDYEHILLGWEDETTILFARRVVLGVRTENSIQPRYDVCRARL